MRKIATIILLISTVMSLGQEAWELPMRDDMVYFQLNSGEFKNKKKPLKEYYYDHSTGANLEMEINSKLRSEMSKKGGNYFSSTNYYMYFTAINSGFSATTGKWYKNNNKNIKVYETKDTLEGAIMISTLTTNKNSLHIFGDKSSNFNITGKIKIIFTNNKYEMKIRGFVVKNLSPNYKKGTVQQNEAFIEDSYKEFVSATKKDKSVEKFFIEFKELLNALNTILSEQLERNIKVAEMD
jgi:hypothetical protein